MTYIWTSLTKYFGRDNCKKALILAIVLALLESFILTASFVYFNINFVTFEVCERVLNICLVLTVISYLFYSKIKLERTDNT